MPYEPDYDSGKYDGELAEAAQEEFLHECARLDMAQGIRPTRLLNKWTLNPPRYASLSLAPSAFGTRP
jgi:hypothetical protein